VSQLDLTAALRRLYGFERFLPGQEEIVRRALAGRDTLAFMPTGSGKSLPYQLAASLRPSPTLVVSPLIALMKDQLDNLPPAVAAGATLVNSTLEPAETERRLEALAAGRVRLLYAAPERLRREQFVAALAAARVGLVVVDEVHCVTMWGHDFRPDYLFIRRALAALGEPPVLGLTATATPETEREIARSLGREFEVVRASVVRANLHHAVEPAEDEEARRRTLLARVLAARGPAIVYARSRRKCEQLSAFLRSHRVSARHYHAGLDSAERTETQEAFLGGAVRVVVATTAFGMGIDKPDIRLVLLYNLPGSLVDYVQMVGRAGRDGRPSDCVLLYGRRDAGEVARFAVADVPSVAALRALYRELRERTRDGVAAVSSSELERDGADPRVLVGMLEQAGLARRGYDAGPAMRVALLPPPEDASGRIASLLGRYERQAVERAARICRYAESARCRQTEIAEHFGEAPAGACGTCDVCTGGEATGVAAFADAAAERLPDDVAGAILRAVSELRWPLGETGLAAMLAGSVSAPPSARRSPGFGVLGAARPGTIRRWVRELVSSGHLEAFESDDGFRLLRAGRTQQPPPAVERAGEAGDVDEALAERLRGWRLERARADGVPAFVVFSDRTLHALAAARPTDATALRAVPGIGPARLERYGQPLLELMRA
jgi:ATP-dependent DNA helicase RecQ